MSDTLDRMRVLAEELVGPELFIRMVEALPDALVVSNEEGIVTLFNAQAELLFGYHRAEILGRPIEVLIPEHLREQHVEHRQGYCRDPRVRPMGVHLRLAARRKNGSELPVEINLSPLQTPDGLFVMAVIRRREAPHGPGD